MKNYVSGTHNHNSQLRGITKTNKFFITTSLRSFTPSNKATVSQKKQIGCEELSLIREQSKTIFSQTLKGFCKVILSLEHKKIEYCNEAA
jgi:hypothetical protein